MTSRKALTSCLALMITFQVRGQEPDYLNIANQFNRRVGGGVLSRGAFSDDRRFYTASSQEWEVKVECSSGNVVSWQRNVVDGRKYEDERSRSSAISDLTAFGSAEAFLGAAGVESYPRDGAVRVNGGQLIRVRFRVPRQNGFYCYTGGGYALEVRGWGRGEVVSFSRKPTYSYPPARVTLNEAQALDRFSQRCQEVLGVRPMDTQVVNLGYRSGSGGELVEIDLTREERERIARVSYYVEGTLQNENESVPLFAWVDAETGQVVRSGYLKSRAAGHLPPVAKLPTVTPVAEQDTSRWPWTFIVGLAVGVILSLGLVICVMRKRRID